MNISYTGNIIIVAAPSGGGKSSLVQALLAQTPGVEVSISHTTRDKRTGEEEGRHYYFVSQQEFAHLLQENAFIESAKVFQHYYGTAKNQILARIQQGIDVLLDIDWQGARTIKSIFPDAILVFILPPSLAALQRRLQHRGRDETAIIEERMQGAKKELQHYHEFDYLIVNDNFDEACAELQAIVIANRLKTSIQSQKHAKLLSFLLNPQ